MAPSLIANLKLCEQISYKTITFIESSFNSLGKKVAQNPWRTIILCWVFIFISSFGLLRFRQERNPMKLWTPKGSKFEKDTDWLMKTFQRGHRTQIMLVKGKDVLTPEVLRQMYHINKRVLEAVTKDGLTWEDVCFRVPFVDAFFASFLTKKRNDSRSEFDPTTEMDMKAYCDILQFFEKGCLQSSILEIWQYNERKMKYLTKEEIVNKIITTKVSPYTGHPVNYEKLLGGIKRNESGQIIAAETVLTLWMVDVNFSAVDMDKVGNMIGTADWVTETTLSWEREFLNVMGRSQKNLTSIELFYASERSFADISGETVLQDMSVVMIGVVLMVIYVQLVLSKFNCIEVRLTLSFLGLLSIGMAFLVAVGLCSLCGIFYGPVHTSFPFLLMGLGVDDMFVIMACWNQQCANGKSDEPLPDRIGKMLCHAGVSITVTSVTDVMVFLIGASSALPSLRSYCLYAATGILFTYIFVITFFTACFTLDQIRVESNRNGIFPCYRHKSYKKPSCSQKQISKKIVDFVYSKIILTKVGKVLVIILTIVFTGIGIDGTLKLREKFDPMWFIPETSYFSKYVKERVSYYPSMGYEAGVYLGKLNYTEEYNKIQYLSDKLENATNILHVTNSWVEPFYQYMTHFYKDLNEIKLSDDEWNMYLSKFLFSPKGAKYQANFHFESELKCGQPIPKIVASSIDIRFNKFFEPEEYIPAMRWTYDVVEQSNFNTGDKYASAWGRVFGHWATDDLINEELIRNLLLALVSVMLCTLILIVNLQMCFWIFICVLLTMVTVCGFMQLWGLTIDIVSCIGLTLAIGLCVDYAAHIAYSFISTSEPTRQERVLSTMGNIGFAVLNGGLSTILALSMLSQSDAYTFQAFFKIFSLVVVFGQFYGIVFLPVILSCIGPKPFRIHKEVPVNNTQ